MITERVAASSEKINTLPGAMADDMLASNAESRMSWSRIIDELLVMYALADNWDGLEAEAPSQMLLNSTIDLVRLLREQPANPIPSRVVPTPIGTILLEWYLPDRYEEWEVTEPYTAECMCAEPGSPARHRDIHWQPVQRSQAIASEQLVLSSHAINAEQSIASERLYQAA